MLRENFQAKPAHINVVSNWGGMGDSVARTPAIRYTHDTYTHLTMHVYWQDYFLPLAKVLLPETDRMKHFKISEAKLFMPGAFITFDPNRITSLRLDLTEQAFLIVNDMVSPSEEARYYPQPGKAALRADLTKKYVVFTVASTAPARVWPAKEINELARRVKARGFAPVLLGSTEPQPTGNNANVKGEIDEEVDRSLFTDLSNQTTLVEALGVIQGASAVLGVDNGLLHLAHCTDVPVVVGYTSVEAKHRLPSRPKGQTIAIEAQVSCYGCQSKCNFIDFNFTKCMFGDYLCTTTMTADRFEKALENLENNLYSYQEVRI